MSERSLLYDQLAQLFAYPEAADYVARVRVCAASIASDHPAAAAVLEPLVATLERLELEAVQELYTRTFDINPVCTLEVGWHVYGEDYARGAYLVELRQRMRELGVTESVELPDHLTHLLALLGRLEGAEADEQAARYLLPALDKMLAAMKQDDSPYRSLLEAVAWVVRDDHRVQAITPRERRGDPPGWGSPLPVFGHPGRPACAPVSAPQPDEEEVS